MELKFIHFYPDLMSLYGSYANVSVLKRMLERLGNAVTVETVRPGGEADIENADFLFMGAGTEGAQKAAMRDFARFGEAVKAAGEKGTAMLFCGTAMDLLGKSVTDSAGNAYAGVGLADFTVVQREKRFVEDVLGKTALYEEPIVGFINKASVITGVETPLITTTELGVGNEGTSGGEGYHENGVFASHLTGPILVKNPRLLETVAAAVYARRGEELPAQLPRDNWAEASFAVTAQALKERKK